MGRTPGFNASYDAQGADAPRPTLEAVMRPSVEAAASRKNVLLFDFELEATRGIVDWGTGI